MDGGVAVGSMSCCLCLFLCLLGLLRLGLMILFRVFVHPFCGIIFSWCLFRFSCFRALIVSLLILLQYTITVSHDRHLPCTHGSEGSS